MLELSAQEIVSADVPVPPRNESDRRVYTRHKPDDLPWLRSVRVTNGPDLSIVDFSAGGLKVEVENYLLRPGSLVTLEIAARSRRLSVFADVLRCHVGSLNSSIRYRGALAFKARVDLSALADDVVARTGPAARGVPPDALPVGWHRIVVRYADGRLAKGFCQDFFPPRGHFHLWQMPSALSRERVTIPIGDLKAVFFVRDFAGDPFHVEDPAAARPASGRPVVVTFLDGEELAGTTMNYQPGALGFFVQPFDAVSNNLRAYVVSRGVRHVRLL